MRVDRFSSFFTAFVHLLPDGCDLRSGQASYTAQVRGVVKDPSGAMVPQATITITNDATGISTTAHTDDHGLYILTGLRPAVYTIKRREQDFARPSKRMSCCRSTSRQRSISHCIRWA